MWVILLIIGIFGFIFSISSSMQKDEKANDVLEGLFERQSDYIKENNLNETPIEYVQGNGIFDDYFSKERDIFTFGSKPNRASNISTFNESIGIYVSAYPLLMVMLIEHLIKNNQYQQQSYYVIYKDMSSAKNFNDFYEFKKKMFDVYNDIVQGGNASRKRYVAFSIDNEVLKIINYVAPQNVKLEIPVVNIISFSKEGDVFTETHISGGGGGGSSLTGAIIGGVVAGSVGAVIGSRKKVDEIKSENIINDKRMTILKYKENNEIKYLLFGSDAYDILLKLIPNKRINFVQKERMDETSKTTTNTNEIVNQIKALSDLNEQGILTEEEFTEKKKMLLAKIQ